MLALYLNLQNWFRSEEGQDLIEYALIIALVVVVAAVGMLALGGKISTLWSAIGNWLNVSVAPMP
jgi:Flp pilus assembly pilin Flp